MTKLTKRVVEASEPREAPYYVWCEDLTGFGVRVFPSGKRVYAVDYRTLGGARRRMSIGPHGKLTTEEARKLALVNLASAVKGGDPAQERTTRRESLTVEELAARYLGAAEAGLIRGKGGRPKKPSTLYVDRGRIERHIIPLLGTKLVKDLVSADIHRFIRDVSLGKTAAVQKTDKLRGKAVVEGGAGTAARTAGLLSGMLSFAVSEGVMATNPAHGVERPADLRRTARLTPEHYGQLGKALAELENEGESWQALLAVRLLALTGCRLGEILGLKWTEVDEAGGCFRLTDSKEGASVRPVGSAAFTVLKAAPRGRSIYVLSSIRSGERFGGLPRAWKRIMARAGLSAVSPHTLRHSFASTAGDLGRSEMTIGALLGHSAATVTSRYVHHLDPVLRATADEVAAAISKQMMSRQQVSV